MNDSCVQPNNTLASAAQTCDQPVINVLLWPIVLVENLLSQTIQSEDQRSRVCGNAEWQAGTFLAPKSALQQSCCRRYPTRTNPQFQSSHYWGQKISIHLRLTFVEKATRKDVMMDEDHNETFRIAKIIAYKAIKDWTDAEEVAQTALVTGMCKYGETNPKLRPLVIGMTKNLVRRHFKDKTRQPRQLEFSEGCSEPSPTSVLRRCHVDRDQRRFLYGAISSFSNPVDRKIAKLYCLGYSAGNSAKMLGISRGSIGPAITRIKRQLLSLKDSA